MKILQAGITNIQSHPHSQIEFHPHLNVITAPSDSGKSVIIRGLKLGITNKSSKNIQRKRSTSCKVSFNDKKIFVARYKDSKSNTYEVQEKGKRKRSFAAVGKKVNDTIKGIINLSEINIQEQKDTFFLINQSSGAVARELNKVSGLSEIDLILKKVNKAISELKTEIKFKNGDIQELETFIREHGWIIQADADLKELEKLEAEISELTRETLELDSMIDAYAHYQKEMDKLIPSSIDNEIADMLKMINVLDEIDESIQFSGELISQHEQHSTALNTTEDIDLSELESLFADITKAAKDIDEIEELSMQYDELDRQQQQIESSIRITEKQLRSFKMCPTCKRPM